MPTTHSVKALTRNSPTTAAYIDTFCESKHSGPENTVCSLLEFTASSLSTADMQALNHSL